MYRQIIKKLRTDGLIGLIRAIVNRLFPLRIQSLDMVNKVVSSGHGFEIGGPSPVFNSKGILPIYKSIQHLDNCNFSSTTVWEGDINKGNTYIYNEKSEAGIQYVSEATSLVEIESESYDFLLSSHMIEHTAKEAALFKAFDIP